MNTRIIPPHGGYNKLISYRKAEIIYDATVKFCERFFHKYDRMVDQMVQAARSGKQNVVEGSMVSGTSQHTEIKLTGVARASLEELLKDYHDYLRTRRLILWDKNSKECLETRELGKKKDLSYETFKETIEKSTAEHLANVLICLIHQTNYLLDRQLEALEKDFLENGGIRERLYKARNEIRNKNHSSNK